jgi:plasmid stabilization system protein ParE
MKVVIDENTSDDLDEIYNCIAKERPNAADSVISRIFAAIENLGRLPRMGHRGRVAGTYEWVVSGLPYVIVYEIQPEQNRIVILGVFHGAREARPP